MLGEREQDEVGKHGAVWTSRALEVRDGLQKTVVFTLRLEEGILSSSRWAGPQEGEW